MLQALALVHLPISAISMPGLTCIRSCERPYRHVADYTDLTAAEAAEIAALTQQAMRTLRAVAGPHGFNIGVNQGSVAGAGIAAHLHQHVVPRWGGDANFMPVIGQTRTIPQLLGETWSLLSKAWPK